MSGGRLRASKPLKSIRADNRRSETGVFLVGMLWARAQLLSVDVAEAVCIPVTFRASWKPVATGFITGAIFPPPSFAIREAFSLAQAHGASRARRRSPDDPRGRNRERCQRDSQRLLG